MLALLEHQFEKRSIKVRRELRRRRRSCVLGIEHKLQQVFLNLFLNARDAMPKGGWLSVARGSTAAQVVAEVSDTGSGIPSEYLARIYDPFFTTKAIGQGTGLGLSITYGIVREHDGDDRLRQRVGQGTRFVLSFPPRRRSSGRSRGTTQYSAGRSRHAPQRFHSGHRRRRDHARDPRGAADARGVHVRLARRAARKGSSWRGRCRSTPRSST